MWRLFPFPHSVRRNPLFGPVWGRAPPGPLLGQWEFKAERSNPSRPETSVGTGFEPEYQSRILDELLPAHTSAQTPTGFETRFVWRHSGAHAVVGTTTQFIVLKDTGLCLDNDVQSCSRFEPSLLSLRFLRIPVKLDTAKGVA